MYRTRTISALWFLFLAAPLSAQTPRIDPTGIDGTLLLFGTYKITPKQADRFVALAGGAEAKLVLLSVDKTVGGSLPVEALKAAARKQDAGELAVAEFKNPGDLLKGATGIWLDVGSADTMRKALQEKAMVQQILAVLRRGGVIAAAGAGVRYLGVKELTGGPCFNLLPDAVIERRGKQKISPVVRGTDSWKELVAYEIDDDAAMLVKGRTISVIGTGAVRIHLPAGAFPGREITLQGKAKEDLTALRRALFDRVHSFPPRKVESPVVENGTLVIVGGGGQPANLTKKFVEYAGGEGKAVIAIFATAAPDRLPKRESLATAFKKAGAKKATVLYGKTPAEVESKEFLDTLKEATGLWFDGGRQWRFVDAYENTKAVPLMFDVLKRGGVIGGTSAGATIQGDYLCRGGVFDNFDIHYEGYQRGLGFLKGVAIDQHFTQRKRQPEMTSLMKVYPQYLGIGLDEATAIVVKGSVADVIGKGKAHFYDAGRKVEKGSPDYEALSAGGRYDLKERKVLAGEK